VGASDASAECEIVGGQGSEIEMDCDRIIVGLPASHRKGADGIADCVGQRVPRSHADVGRMHDDDFVRVEEAVGCAVPLANFENVVGSELRRSEIEYVGLARGNGKAGMGVFIAGYSNRQGCILIRLQIAPTGAIASSVDVGERGECPSGWNWAPARLFHY